MRRGPRHLWRNRGPRSPRHSSPVLGRTRSSSTWSPRRSTADLLQRQACTPARRCLMATATLTRCRGWSSRAPCPPLVPGLRVRKVGDPVAGIVGAGPTPSNGHARTPADAGSRQRLARRRRRHPRCSSPFDALVAQGGLTASALPRCTGASGVGTAAIQIAKAIGRIVVTTSTGKVERCRARCRRRGRLHDRRLRCGVQETTGGRGVDVVLT